MRLNSENIVQALSSIELARQSRIAANRAYLAGLHLGPKAMTGGLVEPVGADSSLVIAAARMLADKAALTEARSQVWICVMENNHALHHVLDTHITLSVQRSGGLRVVE